MHSRSARPITSNLLGKAPSIGFGLALTAALGGAACHGREPDPDVVDAGSNSDGSEPVPRPCWVDEVRVSTGTATLGTGDGRFEPMPEMLPLQHGTQGGYNLVVNVRMGRLAPGNPDNPLDPGNPRTRVHAFFTDTNVPLTLDSHCPFRTAYVPSAGGDYELSQGIPLLFDNCWRANDLSGRRIRLELELVDATGGYATAVATVTAAAPTGSYPSEPEPDAPGCQHAHAPPPALGWDL